MCLADPSTAANVANVLAGTQPTQFYSAVAAAALDGYKATYAAAFVAQSAGTAATTDIFTIFGSASKTIRVLQIGISGTVATTALYADALLQVASAAPTGGTATTLTNVPYDSNDAAGTAVVKFYTATPTAASYVGKIGSQKIFLPLTGTVTLPDQALFTFGGLPGRCPVLRGTSQGLSLSFNALTPANANSLDGFVIWTEE